MKLVFLRVTVPVVGINSRVIHGRSRLGVDRAVAMAGRRAIMMKICR